MLYIRFGEIYLYAVADTSSCSLRYDKGPCGGYMIKWYFDSERQRCDRFIYGGCQGNSNNYETQEECEGACQQETVNTRVGGGIT